MYIFIVVTYMYMYFTFCIYIQSDASFHKTNVVLQWQL